MQSVFACVSSRVIADVIHATRVLVLIRNIVITVTKCIYCNYFQYHAYRTKKHK